MLRFKHFRGSGQALEAAVNAWLEDLEPDVTHMVQSHGDDGSLTLSFLFQESFRAQEHRLANEHGMSSTPGAIASLRDLESDPLVVRSPSVP